MGIWHFTRKEQLKNFRTDVNVKDTSSLTKAMFSMISAMFAESLGYEKYKEILKSCEIEVIESEEK